MSISINSLRGRTNELDILTPATKAFRKSVWTGNRLHWKEKPSLVIRATTRQHVEAAIIFARLLDASITVKNTGHSYAGWGNNDDGILLDVSGIRSAELVEQGGVTTLIVGGGAVWGDAYKLLADFDAEMHSHIIVGGRCPGVGIAGFTLGGGLSPFTRSQGLGMDHLLEVTLVTAKDGLAQTRVVSPTREPEIFKALCGGGGGNFGVVTEMKFSVPELTGMAGMVVTGRFTRWGTLAQQLAFVKALYDTPLTNLKLTVDASWLFDAHEADRVGIRFTVYYDGRMTDFVTDTDAFLRNRAELPENGNALAQYLQDNVHEESCTSLLEESLEEQWSDEQKKFVTATNSFSLFQSYIFKHAGPGHASFYEVVALMGELRTAFRAIPGNAGSGASFTLSLIHGGGKGHTAPRAGEAFPWREGEFFAYLNLVWTEKHLAYRNRMQTYIDAEVTPRLGPHSLGGKASFINFGGSGRTAGGDWKASYYGDNYAELQHVKHECDPDNVFGRKQARHEFRPMVTPVARPPPPPPAEVPEDAAEEAPVRHTGEPVFKYPMPPMSGGYQNPYISTGGTPGYVYSGGTANSSFEIRSDMYVPDTGRLPGLKYGRTDMYVPDTGSGTGTVSNAPARGSAPPESWNVRRSYKLGRFYQINKDTY
ncbi:hypothetical protein DFH27DRAFT_282689 [Peziza echinospora]|nr:hypothetical protein DFH27DRAFT_282689 [Peziza echinospora]